MNRDPNDQLSENEQLAKQPFAEEHFAEELAKLDESISTNNAVSSNPEGSARRDTEIDAALQQAADVLQMMRRVRQFEGESLSHIGEVLETPASNVHKTPATSSEDAATPDSPKMIGRFRVVRLLGAGGFGLVYLAIDTKLDRRVAIKVPRPEILATADNAHRFLREGKAAAALNHPSIIPVYEAGEFGTVAYIASAYCHGSTLAEWLDRRAEPVTPFAAAAIVARLADAAEHAHRRGVLHRDLKPSNVLLELPETNGGKTPDHLPTEIGEFDVASRARISDFGLARLDESTSASKASPSQSASTLTTSTLGTPSYMPPEQADPTLGTLGPASDVYSLGAILYQLLTGRPPFQEATILATLDAVRHRAPTPPHKLSLDIPADLEAITLKCLEKRSAHRYVSAADLADDLERFLDHRPVRARKVGSGERFVRWCRKNPVVASLACAVVLLAIGSTVASIRLAVSRSETRNALNEAVKANEQALLNEYRAQVALAGSIQRSSSPGQRTDSLIALRRAASLRQELNIDSKFELRNLAITALSKSDVTLDRQWPVNVVGESFLTTSPDGERYVQITEDRSGLVSRRIRDGERYQQYAFERPVDRIIGMRYSPDGSWLGARYAIGRGRERLQIWKVDDGTRVADCVIGGFGRAADFSVDGKRLALIAADNRSIEIRRLPEFEIEQKIVRPSPIQTLALSRDAQTIAVHRDGNVDLIATDLSSGDLSSGETIDQLNCPSFAYALEFSPDGRQLVAACRDSRVRLYRLDGSNSAKTKREPVSVLEGHAAMVVTTSWHPTEALLATCSMDGKSRIWDLLGSRSILELNQKCTGFSRDGRWLGIEGGRMQLNRSQAMRSFPQSDSEVLLPIDLGFYPRGKVTSEIDYWVAMPNRNLIIGQNYFRAAFRDVASGRILADVALPGCWFRFGASGQYLYASSQLVGFCRLPIREFEDEDAVTLQIGPPEVIHSARGGAFALSGNRAVLTPFLSTGYILEMESTSQLDAISKLSVHPYTFWSDLSPDGKLAAGGAMKAPNVRVFAADTGQQIVTLPSATAAPWFCPDGKRLVVAENARYTFYDTTRWEPIHRIESVAGGIWPGSLAFSPDGQSLAIEMGSEVHLISADEFTAIAKFRVPSEELIESIGFSRDGRFLFSGGGDQDHTHVWDLTEIRSQLRTLDLDWEPNQPLPRSHSTKPIRLELDLGEISNTKREPSFWNF
ncbi:MAG: WD40 repeat domain-containing serine/threonine protein kinase [Planctomycetota bacterium]